jgi:hypothetical protein
LRVACCYQKFIIGQGIDLNNSGWFLIIIVMFWCILKWLRR